MQQKNDKLYIKYIRSRSIYKNLKFNWQTREESLNLSIFKTETLIEGSFLGANIDGIIVYGETIGSDLKIEFNDKLYEIKLETNVEIPTMIKSDSVTSRSVNLMLFFDRFMNDLSE